MVIGGPSAAKAVESQQTPIKDTRNRMEAVGSPFLCLPMFNGSSFYRAFHGIFSRSR